MVKTAFQFSKNNKTWSPKEPQNLGGTRESKEDYYYYTLEFQLSLWIWGF